MGRSDENTYTAQALPEALGEAGLHDWEPAPAAIRARFATGDFAAGLALVNRIGAAAEAADHHPDIMLSYPQVEVLLTSHDRGAVTDRDLRLAAEISGLAGEAGVTAEH